jgi:hypothetical protein
MRWSLISIVLPCTACSFGVMMWEMYCREVAFRELHYGQFFEVGCTTITVHMHRVNLLAGWLGIHHWWFESRPPLWLPPLARNTCD